MVKTKVVLFFFLIEFFSLPNTKGVQTFALNGIWDCEQFSLYGKRQKGLCCRAV